MVVLLLAAGVAVAPRTDKVADTSDVQSAQSGSEPSASDEPSPTVNINVDAAETELEQATVVKVADGDTIRVNLHGEEVSVRLIGIDTPETNHPTEPVQCYGPEAKDALTDLILNKEVIMEKDVSDVDRYDRYLRYIWIGETFVNEYLTLNGYAFASAYPPDTKYQSRLDAGQVSAESGLVGLWSPDTCDGDVYTGTYKDPDLNTQGAGAETVYSPSVGEPAYNSTVQEPAYVAPVVPAAASQTQVAPTPATGIPPTSSKYTCNCSKTCPNMASCEEAYFQLNECGCHARDGDSDGVPCESICK